jgi:alkylation response protein AidB-like acyl-CoA dehydrogenase
MDFGLSADQQEIQRTARELLSERAKPERVREHAEGAKTDMVLWRELCELGWPGIAVSESYGGQGLGAVECSILCEELGRTVAPVPFASSVMASAVIEHAGSDAQRERWLPGLASGEVIGAIGRAEGSRAPLVIGAPEAQVIVLLQEDHARLLTASEAGVKAIPTIDPTRSVGFVSVDATGEELDGDIGGGSDRALIALAAGLVGVCGRALQMTVAYVKDRRQFGVPVGSFQAVSHRCAQMLLETEKARSTVALAAWTAGAEPGQLAETAAMAKAAASEAAMDVTASAIQAHGGIGFTWEADIHWLYKRAQLDGAFLGGAAHHRARLAGILAGRLSARLTV